MKEAVKEKPFVAQPERFFLHGCQNTEKEEGAEPSILHTAHTDACCRSFRANQKLFSLFRGKRAVFPLTSDRAALCVASHVAFFTGKMR